MHPSITVYQFAALHINKMIVLHLSTMLINPFLSDTLTNVMAACYFGSKVKGQKILYIICSRSILLCVMIRKHTNDLHYVQVDSDEVGRQSKMATN